VITADQVSGTLTLLSATSRENVLPGGRVVCDVEFTRVRLSSSMPRARSRAGDRGDRQAARVVAAVSSDDPPLEERLSTLEEKNGRAIKLIVVGLY